MQQEILRTLDDKSLLGELRKLIGQDLRTQADILRCLAVVEERRLYLDQGYNSLWMFCHRGLGCSESMAQRRVMAVRACKIAPEAFEMVENGRVSLCTLAQVGKHITPENRSTLLTQVAGKSSREVERVLAGLNPTMVMLDVIRQLVVADAPVKQAELVPENEATSNAGSPTGKAHIQPALLPETTAPRKMHRISFTAGDETMRNIERLRQLLGAKEIDQVLLQATEALLDRCDPLRREARRTKRQNQRREKPTANGTRGSRSSIPVQQRAVPRPLRDATFVRDGVSCAWVSPEGVRCGAKTHLEVDHIQPWALGGQHKPENLRVLCRAHNLHRARKTFGHAAPNPGS